MALNTNKDLKKYYAINEVAEQFGVADSLLRYWEKMFPSLVVRKSAKGVRQYTQENIEEIRVIYNLVKVRGMKLAAAKDVLRKNHAGASQTSELIDRLQEIRADLRQLQRELNNLPE